MIKTECFKIQIIKGDDPFNIVDNTVVKQVLCDKKSGFREPKTIIADPFLFTYKGVLYLFYEDKMMTKNGVISMICTRDLIKWSEPVEVLRESCHLSYPWVFENNGNIYMIPETCGLKEIRLYKGNENLTRFEYLKTILKDNNEYLNGFSFSDSSIYKHNSNYYLMTTINDGEKNILKLYISDKLDRNYKEHPLSPICIGNKYGRNAGSLFDYKDKLYRVAQDCEKRYGDNVNLIEVQDISPISYKEIVVQDNIIPNKLPFYEEGGHQFNFSIFKNHYIVATDAKEYHYFFLYRFINKLGKKLLKLIGY